MVRERQPQLVVPLLISVRVAVCMLCSSSVRVAVCTLVDLDTGRSGLDSGRSGLDTGRSVRTAVPVQSGVK